MSWLARAAWKASVAFDARDMLLRFAQVAVPVTETDFEETEMSHIQ